MVPPRTPLVGRFMGSACVRSLLKEPGVKRGRCDQCMFGQQVRGQDGTWGPARKRTGFMSNSPGIISAVSRDCNQRHQHVRLIGGIARQAAHYPLRLVLAILTGFVRDLRAQGVLMSVAAGPTVEEPDLTENLPEDVEDEITGAMLDGAEVQKAIHEEIEYMHKLKVYERATVEEAKEDGCILIPTRWVHINKGDKDNPQIRSRMVIQETKRRAELDAAATFASTPPLESVKLLLSLSVSGNQGQPRGS